MDELSFSVKTLSKNVILHVYERTPTKNHDVNTNSFLHTLHLCDLTRTSIQTLEENPH